MNQARWIPAFLGLTLLLALPAARPQDPAPADPKDAKVRKLLDLTGAADVGKQMIDEMLGQFESLQQLPPGFSEKFKALAGKEDLVELVIPVYRKNLDDATLDGAIAFYESEAGRSMVKAQPAILKESMEAGQKWGQELALRALQMLEEKGPKDE